MAHDHEALVKRLREEAADWDEPKHLDEVDVRGMLHEAADLIEQQAARIAELEAALRTISNDRYNFASIQPLIERLHGWQQIARQALGDKQ